MSSRRPILDDRAYRKVVNAWAMYDWGNSAFATTIMAAVFLSFTGALLALEVMDPLLQRADLLLQVLYASGRLALALPARRLRLAGQIGDPLLELAFSILGC